MASAELFAPWRRNNCFVDAPLRSYAVRMTRESKGYQALIDACRIADSLALLERVRRSYAARGVGKRASKTRTEFVVDATQAFIDRPAVQRANLTELQRHLERIRAHGEAIATLQGRFHSVKRNC